MLGTIGITTKRRIAGRWWALVCLTAAMIGPYYMLYALTPLQTTLQQDFGWSIEDYGRYCSAEAFLNVVCCVLLFSGFFLDKFGYRKAGAAGLLLMLIGTMINAIGVVPNSEFQISNSANISCIGFMIFGVGIELLAVAASKATIQWFKGKNLALAIGLQLAVSRFVVAASYWVSPRVAADADGNIIPLHSISLAILLILIGIVAWGCLWKIHNAYDNVDDEADGRFKFADLKLLGGSSIFWIMTCLIVAYYASVTPFFRFCANMLQCELGLTEKDAADIVGLMPLGVAVLTPLFCQFVDRKGNALWMLISGTSLILVCYTSFAYLVPATQSLVIAWCTVSLFTVCSALVTASFWPMVPLVVPQKVLGSAYAWIYWLQNLGFMAVPVVVAYVLSQTNPGRDADSYSYSGSMWVFIAVMVIAVSFTLYLFHLNKKQNLQLNKPFKL